MFVHLNVHSNYSQMRGTATQQVLLTKALKYGMRSMALTEFNGIWGFIRFVQHSKAAGIVPIAGVNLITTTADIVVLVENQLGYENMCHAISKVHKDNSQILADIFKTGYAGLFVLAHQENTLKELNQFVPNSNLFVELRPGIEETQTHQLAKKFRLEVVATSDVYFINPKDQKAHSILRAIENNTTLSNLDPKEVKSDKHWSEKFVVKK